MAKKRSPYLSHLLGRGANDNTAPYNAKLAARTIDDPWDSQHRTATARVDADVLGLLLAKRKIGYHHERTGRDLEQAFERVEIGSLKAMDFSREPVNSSRSPADGWNDAKRKASNFIAHAKRTLGNSAFRLVELILRERHSLDEVAGALTCDRRFVIVRLRDALEKLATASGNAGVGRPAKRTPRDKHLRAALEVEREERGAIIKFAA